MPTRPFLDFGVGYIRRAVDQLPRQGDRTPWLTSMSYHADVGLLRADGVDDPELCFARSAGGRLAPRPRRPARPPSSRPGRG
ncbi:hypothetical protein [Streptomyces sp. NPDC058373]|uniref:hypothetical protein n=1 Tax=Streptomyces sp. NPDC058373 TaxID=3346465 RepID=UPI0036496508